MELKRFVQFHPVMAPLWVFFFFTTNIFWCLGFPVWRVAQHSQLQVINHFSTLRKDECQHESYLVLPFLSQCHFNCKERHPSSNRKRNLVTLGILSRSGSEEPGAHGRVLALHGWSLNGFSSNMARAEGTMCRWSWMSNRSRSWVF